MLKKLTRHGNSMALVLDKPVLELMNIKADTALEISTDGKRLIVEPSHGASKRKRLERWLKKADEKYGETFRALSRPS